MLPSSRVLAVQIFSTELTTCFSFHLPPDPNADDNDSGWSGGDGGWQGQRPAPKKRQSRPKSEAPREAPAQPPAPQPPKERPDAKHHLKFTYGVNAWKHWVVQKVSKTVPLSTIIVIFLDKSTKKNKLHFVNI